MRKQLFTFKTNDPFRETIKYKIHANSQTEVIMKLFRQHQKDPRNYKHCFYQDGIRYCKYVPITHITQYL